MAVRGGEQDGHGTRALHVRGLHLVVRDDADEIGRPRQRRTTGRLAQREGSGKPGEEWTCCEIHRRWRQEDGVCVLCVWHGLRSKRVLDGVGFVRS